MANFKSSRQYINCLISQKLEPFLEEEKNIIKGEKLIMRN